MICSAGICRYPVPAATSTPTRTPTPIGGIPTPTPTPMGGTGGGGGGIITYEETQGGTGSSTTTVTTTTTLSGGTNQLYVATVGMRGNVGVSSLSGLGLSWTRRIRQCSGRGVQGLELWTAYGSPGAGTVTVNLASTSPAVVLFVSRYSGADPTVPVDNATGSNTTGQDTGDCASGTDTNTTTITGATLTTNSVLFVATDSRGRTITTSDPDYTERGTGQAGSSGDLTILTVHDRIPAPASDVITHTLSGTADWAMAALAIRPAPLPTPTPVPDSCVSSSDCPIGGTCVSNTCTTSCINDTECPAGQICSNKGCFSTCTTNAQCASTMICSAGICRYPLPPDTPTPTPGGTGGGTTGEILYEESTTWEGSTTGVTPPQFTTTTITGGTGQLYVLSIAMRGSVNVNDVQGLTLSWTKRIHQCSGRGVQSLEIWSAFGDATDGSVTVSFDTQTPAYAATISRYSGADPTVPVDNATGSNTTGQDTGDCASGTDTNTTTITGATLTTNSVLFVATDSRNRTITTSDPDYTERGTGQVGSGGDLTVLTVHDRIPAPASDVITHTLSGTADWAMAALALNPASGAPIPTPAVWIQVVGGDVYQPDVDVKLPSGKKFVEEHPGMPKSGGVVWSQSGKGKYGSGTTSTDNQEVSGTFTNPYTYEFYKKTLEGKGTTVNNTTVGEAADLLPAESVYHYQGTSPFTLSSAFTPVSPVTVFLIPGDLLVTADFSIDGTYTLVFFVAGNVRTGGTVTRIPGLYSVDGSFILESSSEPFILDGMIYADSLTVNRTFKDNNTPTVQIIYQPHYVINLLPVIGRKQVEWGGE